MALKRRDRIAITVAAIPAVGGIIAALIQTQATNSIASPPPTPAPATSAASSRESRDNSAASLQPATNQPATGRLATLQKPEREEFGAKSFASYSGVSGVERTIAAGQIVRVICRIPGNSATPASIGRAGWYRTRFPDGTVGYVAANTFYNDPGNGYGRTPNNVAFDPAVPRC